MTREVVAVIDLETTGLSPWRHDRVIEVGIVCIAKNGEVVAEYETLINPLRDVGPTSIHGIDASDVVRAPIFEDIAGDIVSILKKATAVAGHNVAFDKNFLLKEFDRLGLQFPQVPMICSFQLLGRSSLSACCEEFGVITPDVPHRALSDARATAELISLLWQEEPDLVARHAINPDRWPTIQVLNTPCLRREDARHAKSAPPEYLQRLARKTRHDVEAHEANVLAYLALIDRVLEDRLIDESEANAIVDAAVGWGLSSTQVTAAHRQYLQNLVFQALADGVVTESERKDLHVVAQLLGQDDTALDALLESASRQLAGVKRHSPTENVPQKGSGQRVCFTGELQSTCGGEPVTRELAEFLAEKAGFVVSSGVTKKLDMLIVSDPNTQSTKAKKARDYNVRILSETVFWRMAGVRVD
jgi:DNA polymerase-3 subunit epsilon